jgi:hypothetical protein
MEIQYLCLFPGPTTDGIGVCHSVHFVNISHVLVKSTATARFMAFLCSSQKLPSAGGPGMFATIYTCRLSFQTNAVVSSLTLTRMCPFFSPSLLLHKSCGALLTWSDWPTATLS